MPRSPLSFQRTFVVILMAVVAAHVPATARGQAEMPVVEPPAAQIEPAPQTPAENAPTAPPILSPAELYRSQELLRLHAQLQQQRASNRRWQVPLLGLALGTDIFGMGFLLFAHSQRHVGDLPCTEDNQPCGYDEKMFRAGLVLMFLGPALMVVSVPMLIVRGARQTRMRETERDIRRLGGTLAFAPLLGPRGEAGLRVHARF